MEKWVHRMFAEPEWMKKFILTCSNLHPDSDLKKEFDFDLANAFKPVFKALEEAKNSTGAVRELNVCKAQKYHFLHSKTMFVSGS